MNIHDATEQSYKNGYSQGYEDAASGKQHRYPNPMRYDFGEKLLYVSPKVNGLKTPCLFIRDDNGKAVVMFQHAEWAARVNYRQLEKEAL